MSKVFMDGYTPYPASDEEDEDGNGAAGNEEGQLMTHKYRGCIVVLSINKSVEPNEEQKVLTSSFDEGFTVNTKRQVCRGF